MTTPLILSREMCVVDIHVKYAAACIYAHMWKQENTPEGWRCVPLPFCALQPGSRASHQLRISPLWLVWLASKLLRPTSVLPQNAGITAYAAMSIFGCELTLNKRRPCLEM